MTKKPDSPFDPLVAPLAAARGLGSSHAGAHHWMHQRVTALANIPLMVWLVWSVMHMAHDYPSFVAWLQQPVHAVLMILAVISVFYHAALGSQVVIEDYIHNEGFKLIKLISMKLFFFAAAVACIFSILKIAFTG